MYVPTSVLLGISAPRHNGQSNRQPRAELVAVTTDPTNNSAITDARLINTHLNKRCRSGVATARSGFKRTAIATIVAQASIVSAAKKCATTVIGAFFRITVIAPSTICTPITPMPHIAGRTIHFSCR